MSYLATTRESLTDKIADIDLRNDFFFSPPVSTPLRLHAGEKISECRTLTAQERKGTMRPAIAQPGHETDLGEEKEAANGCGGEVV